MTLRRFTVRESREAILVTTDNLDEVAEWCGGTVRQFDLPDGTVSEYIDYDSTEGLVSAYPCYVLITDGHRWWDMPADEFERQSVQWEEQT